MPTSKPWIQKLAPPLVHVLSLVPLAILVLKAFGVGGLDLGPDPVEYLLHQLGWWGLALLMVTLAVSPLRRISGLNWLAPLRRPIGLYAFLYVALHFVVYGALDRQLDFSTIGEDLAKRPYILIGTLSFLMLVPLAITSTRSWIRRLGRNWQKLHYLIYPATALGVWHFYWQVKKDAREPLLFAGVLAALLAWRAFGWLRRRTR